MELEFLNTEPDFDCSWLPADIEQPECIASENAQVALDVFCREVRDFLLNQCPEHESQINSALKQGQTFHGFYSRIYNAQVALDVFCREVRDQGQTFHGFYSRIYNPPVQIKDLLLTIADWFETVFEYQLTYDAYAGLDCTFRDEIDADTRNFLDTPEINDIPRRLAAMRRLREAWSKMAPHSGIEAVRRECQIDMSDWDKAAA